MIVFMCVLRTLVHQLLRRRGGVARQERADRNAGAPPLLPRADRNAGAPPRHVGVRVRLLGYPEGESRVARRVEAVRVVHGAVAYLTL